MIQIRLPRFRRVRDVPRIELTERDKETLLLVHRHRFLRSSHLVQLLPGSRQQILRRLQRLYHHGFLERPRAQIEYFGRNGSRAIAYGLGNKGAAWLKHNLNLPSNRMDWGGRNRSAGRLFLDHALLISDVMVALELACRRHGKVRLLTDDALPLPDSLRARFGPLQWRVSVNHRTKLGVIPDRVFGLEIQERAGRPKRAFFFLEADRGTMPVERQTLAISSVYRKMLAYEATWTQGLHRSRLGFHRFRVLTVTTTPARVRSMIDACRALERGRGLFLFTDVEAFRTHEDPLALAWHCGRCGSPESLTDGLSPKTVGRS
jgi:Replication-relaxation